MKYRKRPVVIEAFQYDGDLQGKDGKYYVPNWAVTAFYDGTIFYTEHRGRAGELFISTLEGDHHVTVGDYIIRGVQGELYPCKPDIFRMTYEPVALQEKQERENGCGYCMANHPLRTERHMHKVRNSTLLTWELDEETQEIIRGSQTDGAIINYCPMCGRKLGDNNA